MGFTFNEEEKKTLKENGNLGKLVTLQDNVSRQTFQGYIGIDQETNGLTVFRADRLKMPDEIRGVKLSPVQKEQLLQGGAVLLSGLAGSNGQKYEAYVQINAAKRSLSFAPLAGNSVKQTVNVATAQELERPSQALKGTDSRHSLKTEQKTAKATNNMKRDNDQQQVKLENPQKLRRLPKIKNQPAKKLNQRRSRET
ncbi:hypothetical protein GCM10023189_40490 [Nibrella saemangeumensis]|uniref:DUF3945 domain-containing protein n=1 Tax=Nibrella saemangeumensis TaxID=1084526 RepID=A0ABP8NCI4_9BACT